MLELSEFFLNLHKENKVDYLAKYKSLAPEENETVVEQIPEKETRNNFV